MPGWPSRKRLSTIVPWCGGDGSHRAPCKRAYAPLTRLATAPPHWSLRRETLAAEHDRLYCLLARHTPKRLASAASRRPEGQPVNHDADAPGHQPQDPIDDGQWPRQDQEKDRDEAAMVATLADDDDLRTLPTRCSRRVELGSYPTLLRRPLHPGARSGRAGRLSLHSRLTGRRARHRWAAMVRHRPRLGLR